MIILTVEGRNGLCFSLMSDLTEAYFDRILGSRSTPDLYEVLGVAAGARGGAIKKAYHRLALRYHPDKRGGDSKAKQKKAEKIFKLVSQAYAVLSDEDKRVRYDNYGVFEGAGSSVPSTDDLEAFNTFFQSFLSKAAPKDDEGGGGWGLHNVANYELLDIKAAPVHLENIANVGFKYLVSVLEEEMEELEIALLQHMKIEPLLVMVAYQKDKPLDQDAFFEGYSITYFDEPLEKAIQPKWSDQNTLGGERTRGRTKEQVALLRLSEEEFAQRKLLAEEAERRLRELQLQSMASRGIGCETTGALEGPEGRRPAPRVV